MPSPAATATTPTVQLLSPAGELVTSAGAEEYRAIVDALDDDILKSFHRHMAVTRAFDIEAANLQRQGQLALWVPSLGQEAAQVGSAFATRPQDHIFPAYREHSIAMIHGVDPVDIIRLWRGNTTGGWVPAEKGNFHLYTLVIGSQSLHATGYAMGVLFDGDSGTGDAEHDQAVIAYVGDGAMSQGDVSESFVFAASYQTPSVFFLQNNQWAISVPVVRQSRTPLYLRGEGFGIPSVQVDGNDVLASYAVTRKALDEARAGGGPRFIEALTYRMGAHTSSDDPTRYRPAQEMVEWEAKDPIVRYETWLRGKGADEAFFAEVAAEGADLAADVRRRTMSMQPPGTDRIFDFAYTDPHPLVAAQKQWLADYEAGFDA
jgi:2-oxoisovalerate dehydrogenase E1 component alpha subunit